MENIKDFIVLKEVEVMNTAKNLKESAKENVKEFFVDEEGDTNIIAIVLILIIVIGLAALFHDKIFALFNDLWDKVTGGSDNTAASGDNWQKGK
ncbi:MAG: hypothetical protein K6F77_06805 [Lachnospiraceae bacterium]|nr:hypothetical protein [Lachnospiraceae bacterium]